jgi:hypothetical protein
MHQTLFLLPLAKGAVTSVRKSTPALLKVLSGQVWLTETPAQRDLVLTAGEEVELRRTAPWVIEALSDAQLEIRAC